MKALKILIAAGLAFTATSVIAQTIPGTLPAPNPAPIAPGGGIKGTKHDWSKAAGTSVLVWLDGSGAQTTYNTGTAALDPVTGKQIKQSITIGLCTKCHTPHQAVSTNLLWNHTLQTTSYEWDVPATTAGTVYPKFKGDTYKGASTKCLSCHDGLMASTDGMWFNRQRTSGSPYVCTGPNCLNSGHEVAEGADMSGSHPVAFPYPYNNSPSAYNGTTTGTTTVSWLAEFISDPTLAGIRLFNDDGSGNIVAGAVGGRTGMECTSCHDVHNGPRTKDVMLLTGKLTGSSQADGYICEQCHKK